MARKQCVARHNVGHLSNASSLLTAHVTWAQAHVRSLRPAREQLWAALQPLLSHELAHADADAAPPSPPLGAFYYLLPLPAGLPEDQAIRLLAAGDVSI